MEKTLFENLKATLSRYRSHFFLGCFFVLFSNLLLILNPLIFRHAVQAFDTQTEPSNDLLGSVLAWLFGSHFHTLSLWILLLIAVAAVSSYFKYKMRLTFISMSRMVERDVRAKLFGRIQSQSMAFFDRHGIGELLSRLTNDITSYRDVLGPGIMYPLFFLTVVFPGLAALFLISVPLATLSVIPLFVIPLVNVMVRGRIYTVSHGVQESLGRMSNMVQEHYSAIRIVKSYVLEKPLYERFRELALKVSQLNFRLSVMQGLLFPFFLLLTKGITVALVLFSGYIILRAWSELSTADFVSFMWIQSYIFFPVLMLGWLIPVYERGRAAYERLVEIYEEPVEVKGKEASNLRIQPDSEICFHQLSFTYPTADKPSLKGIDLCIQPGSFVGITGPVGSGKTTLFRLLNREYEIPKGAITIGGHDIQEYPLNAFRDQMVTVEQVPFLFSKTIAENVRFGRPEASNEEIALVAQHADLHDTVLEFPEQYETMIGERGVTLSGGQKQRVAMARAFLVNRSILLLDDIFSAVDAETEKRIFESMRKNFAGKTLFLITHRLTLLDQMDRVIYMMNGSVVEDGSPDQLKGQDGYYAALTALQRLE